MSTLDDRMKELQQALTVRSLGAICSCLLYLEPHPLPPVPCALVQMLSAYCPRGGYSRRSSRCCCVLLSVDTRWLNSRAVFPNEVQVVLLMAGHEQGNPLSCVVALLHNTIVIFNNTTRTHIRLLIPITAHTLSAHIKHILSTHIHTITRV